MLSLVGHLSFLMLICLAAGTPALNSHLWICGLPLTLPLSWATPHSLCTLMGEIMPNHLTLFGDTLWTQ